jgi:hypothetical protein
VAYQLTAAWALISCWVCISARFFASDIVAAVCDRRIFLGNFMRAALTACLAITLTNADEGGSAATAVPFGLQLLIYPMLTMISRLLTSQIAVVYFVRGACESTESNL